MGKATKLKPKKTEADRVADKAAAIGMPIAQLARGDHVIVETPIRDAGRVKTEKTLVNRGGTPVARWKAAALLSESQIAAIDHCERLWDRLPGKGLVADLTKAPGAGAGDGWVEQEALDDLRRIKGYVPARYWSVFENVCRFDEGAGFAGSAMTSVRSDQVTAARLTVMFVADIIAMNERLITC
jgi:hypothetical protein